MCDMIIWLVWRPLNY